MSTVQPELLYTKEHEWILMEDNVATIGISDHAQAELGDITFVELPDDDMEMHAGDEVANIESVKAASPVFSPLSGTVIEVNNDLEESPETVNHDCYGAGWVYKLEVSDTDELSKLMDAEAYEAYLEGLEDEE